MMGIVINILDKRPWSGRQSNLGKPDKAVRKT
jgi:hypothetical protein